MGPGVGHRCTTGAGTGFTAVRALAADDVWVVGSRLTQRGLKPIVAHWNGRDLERPIDPGGRR